MMKRRNLNQTILIDCHSCVRVCVSSFCSEQSRTERTELSGHESVTFMRLKVTKISMFFVQVSIKLHRGETPHKKTCLGEGLAENHV